MSHGTSRNHWMILGLVAILACLMPLTGCQSGGLGGDEVTALTSKDQLETTVGKKVTLTGDIAVQPFKTVYLIGDGFAVRLPASFADQSGAKDVTITGVLKVEPSLAVPAAEGAATQAAPTTSPAIYYLDDAAVVPPPAPAAEAAPASAPTDAAPAAAPAK